MSNRIDTTFSRLRTEKRKGFIPYICAGDPDLDATIRFAAALEKAGADVLELGLPFSDPLADGIVNQLAAQRALSSGTTTRGLLEAIRKIRRQSDIPIVLYTYLNPILQFGWNEFHRDAAEAGVDGLLLLDLPPEEDHAALEGSASSRPLLSHEPPIHIRLIAPTTPVDRIALIAKTARGFLYYVSREGVTGARDTIASSLGDQVAQIRKLASLPIAVGFGISTPQQAAEVARHADAVVIGSAIVDIIAKEGAEASASVASFAQNIVRALKQ